MTDPRMDAPLETMAEGRFLALRKRGHWEYADRPRDIRAAVILAAGLLFLVLSRRSDGGGAAEAIP